MFFFLNGFLCTWNILNPPERWILALPELHWASHIHDVPGHLCCGTIGTAQPVGHPMVGDVPWRHPPDLWTSPRCWRPTKWRWRFYAIFTSHMESQKTFLTTWDLLWSADLNRKCPSTSLQPFSTNTTSTWVFRCGLTLRYSNMAIGHSQNL